MITASAASIARESVIGSDGGVSMMMKSAPDVMAGVRRPPGAICVSGKSRPAMRAQSASAPCGSVSMNRTVPCSVSAMPVNTVDVDFPTPPFQFAKVMIII